MSENAIKTLLANSAEDVLAQLDDYALEQLEQALAAEKTGEKRKGVQDAIAKKIKALKDQKPVTGNDAGDSKATTTKAPVKKGPVDMLGNPLKKA